MNIHAIGDLHLSGQPPRKPMSVFGADWDNHWEKVQNSWRRSVTNEDIVLVCGDTSWAMKFNDALFDLTEIASLPGKKIFIRGNHDYWWSTLNKMNAAGLPDCFFLQNNFYACGGAAVCGSRGWLTPGSEGFSPEDEKIYLNELARVETSLAQAQVAGHSDIILALHYPPLYADGAATGFSRLCDKYKVKHCVYGHLHGDSAACGWQGKAADTVYHLVSADSLQFKLKLIT